MNLLDRITGRQIPTPKLPGHILPGRYLLTQKAKINGHTVLNEGSILMGDGSGRIKLNDNFFVCNENIEDQHKENYKLICQALLQINEAIDFSSCSYPSPLIPSRLLDDEANLNELEELLEAVIGKGHLHEISRNPRFDMRYDDIILPVSRAKRLANSAQRHLASHSECWQQRTFTGIHPRKVMGLVSEDEYHLYENRVFARLNDNLLRFLNKRLREVRDLISKLNEALSLKDSTELVFLLSQKLYENWGETFAEKDTHSYIELLNRTKKRLEALQRSVRGLIQGFLYKRIPRNAQIPGQIEQTNILSHDQHYRYLPPLWNKLKTATQSEYFTPEELMKQNQVLQEAYSRYAGMLVLRALKQTGFTIDNSSDRQSNLTRAGLKVTVTENDMNWMVTDEVSDYSLIFVPIFSWEIPGDCQVENNKRSLVIPVSIQAENKAEHPVNYLTGKARNHLTLSPLNFYSEEQLISVINFWLLIEPIKLYGTEIQKIPSSVMPLLENSVAFTTDDKHNARMIRLPSKQELDEIIKVLRKENANSVIHRIKSSFFSIESLSRCPGCQHDADFYERDRQTFKAQCGNSHCQLEWSISFQHGKKIFDMLPRNVEVPDFANSGRWFYRVPLDEVKRK